MSKAPTQGSRPKKRYRTRNWREYDRGLIARGDLTVWISPELAWHASAGTGRRGRPPVFTDAAIQSVLTLKVLYQLPLRAAPDLTKEWLRRFRERLVERIWPILDHPEFDLPASYRRLRYYTDFGGADWCRTFSDVLTGLLHRLAEPIRECWVEVRMPST